MKTSGSYTRAIIGQFYIVGRYVSPVARLKGRKLHMNTSHEPAWTHEHLARPRSFRGNSALNRSLNQNIFTCSLKCRVAGIVKRDLQLTRNICQARLALVTKYNLVNLPTRILFPIVGGRVRCRGSNLTNSPGLACRTGVGVFLCILGEQRLKRCER